MDSSTPDEDPHEGLQAIYFSGAIWRRYSDGRGGFEDWLFITPEECELLVGQFATTPRADWHYLQAQTLAKQLRNALEAYRKDNP